MRKKEMERITGKNCVVCDYPINARRTKNAPDIDYCYFCDEIKKCGQIDASINEIVEMSKARRSAYSGKNLECARADIRMLTYRMPRLSDEAKHRAKWTIGILKQQMKAMA